MSVWVLTGKCCVESPCSLWGPLWALWWLLNALIIPLRITLFCFFCVSHLCHCSSLLLHCVTGQRWVSVSDWSSISCACDLSDVVSPCFLARRYQEHVSVYAALCQCARQPVWIMQASFCLRRSMCAWNPVWVTQLRSCRQRSSVPLYVCVCLCGSLHE